MKKLIYLIALLPLAFGCDKNAKHESALSVEDSLRAVSGGYQVRIQDQDSSIQSFITGYNEIQANLDAIKEKEKIVSSNSKTAETRKAKQDQIVDDIQQMSDIMNKNKQRLAAMKNQLASSKTKSAELEQFVTRLTADIEAKDAQINDLKTQ